MPVEIRVQDLFENEEVFGKVMWNIFEPLNSSEEPQKREAQLLTLKLVSKKFHEVTCNHISRLRLFVTRKYSLFFKNDNVTSNYNICELMILCQFSNEAFLGQYLRYPHCYSNLEGVATLSNLFDKVTFRLKIKLDLSKDALAAICKLSTDQKKADHSFISQVMPLSKTLLHKNVINFFLLSKSRIDNFRMVGTSYISENWSYILLKLLCKAMNSLLRYKSDLEVLIKNDKILSIHYSFPLTTHEKNPFLLLKNSDLSKSYNLCIQTRNTYLNDIEQTPRLIDFHETEHIYDRNVTLEKLVVVCWPSSYPSNQDTAFLTFDTSSTFGIDSDLSPDFLEALCNIYCSINL